MEHQQGSNANHFSQNKQTNQVVLERRRCGSSSNQHLAKNKLVTESTAACGRPEAAAPAGERGFPTMHKNIRIHIISFDVPLCVLNTPPLQDLGGSSCVKITKIGVILLLRIESGITKIPQILTGDAVTPNKGCLAFSGIIECETGLNCQQFRSPRLRSGRH